MSFALLAVVGGSAAGAEPPGRYLESRRAAAAVVYLATVSEVREVAPADADTAARMEATLTVDTLFRPARPASPAPAAVVVRYEQGAASPDMATGVFYRLKAGDRALVFAGSFDKAFPVEIFTGTPGALSTQVSALRAFLAAMDEMTASLHSVTPAIRAQQLALYDRVLAELRSRPRAVT